MFNIVFLISSYRKRGNTSQLLQLLKEKLSQLFRQKKIEAEINNIFLAHQNIIMCKGCRICFDKGEKECPLKDDILNIKEKFAKADFVILASPVYVEDVNGIMKNWIDRMAFICHRPEFFEKGAYVLSTSGIGSAGHPLNTMAFALRTWGLDIVGRDSFKTGAIMKKEDIDQQYGKNIKHISEKIMKYLTKKKKKITFYSLLVFKIQQLFYNKEMDKDSFDYNYWLDQGWLDKNTYYYTNTQVNPIKVKLARFIGYLISKFVLK